MKKLINKKTNSPVYCIRVAYNEQYEKEKLYIELFKTAALWGILLTGLAYIFTL